MGACFCVGIHDRAALCSGLAEALRDRGVEVMWPLRWVSRVAFCSGLGVGLGTPLHAHITHCMMPSECMGNHPRGVGGVWRGGTLSEIN